MPKWGKCALLNAEVDLEMEEEKNTQASPTEASIVHEFDKSKGSFFSPKLLVVLIVVILLGIGSGYLLSSRGGSSLGANLVGGQNSSNIAKGTVEGSNDTSTFKDTAEGVLKTGGIDGEGTYHLVRPGGDSQNVYLTSSIVDLSKYINRKIKVWGQTQKAQHAGWLMDVGRIEVLE